MARTIVNRQAPIFDSARNDRLRFRRDVFGRALFSIVLGSTLALRNRDMVGSLPVRRDRPYRSGR
jgi:hypothetical protein